MAARNVAMKRRRRIDYTHSQKASMRARWRAGESLQRIARLFDRNHSSVRRIPAETGGIQQKKRRRSRLAPTFAEREEISRSALARRLCDKRRGRMLNLFASTLRALRVSGLMLREMFNMFERLATLLTTVLVSRHGIPPAPSLHVSPRTKPGRRAAPPMRHCSSGHVQTLIVHAWPAAARAHARSLASRRSLLATRQSRSFAPDAWPDTSARQPCAESRRSSPRHGQTPICRRSP